jgi:hypothetical protein
MTIIKSIFSVCFIGLCTLLTAQNPSTINGSISMTDETSAAITAQFGQELFKKGVIFEVWSVVYREVISETGGTTTNVYFNEKVKNTRVSPSMGADGINKTINFTASGIPAQGDFVLLYYFTNYPTQLKRFEPGSRLNDGTDRFNLEYATNVEEQLGRENLKYGVFSIGANRIYKTDLGDIVMPAGTSAKFSLFGTIKKIGSGIAKIAWKGGKAFVGVIVDKTGTLIAQAYGISQAVFADGYLPDYRNITDAEYNWVNTKIFNGNLPTKIQIVITNLYGKGHRQFVFPTGVGGVIMMNLGEKGFANPMGKIRYKDTDPFEKEGTVFIHEMTHVWQIYTIPDIGFTIKSLVNQHDGDSAYNYDQLNCENGKNFRAFNLEQQGQIVKDCYLKRGANRTGSCQEQLVVASIRQGVAFAAPQAPPPPKPQKSCDELRRDIEGLDESLKERQGLDINTRKAILMSIGRLKTQLNQQKCK